MNKLYEAIEPVVLDDELLRKALAESSEAKEAKKNGIELSFNQIENLSVSFQSKVAFLSPLIHSSTEVRRIASNNLFGFDKLTKLQLDNNEIEKIENLDHLVHLTWLGIRWMVRIGLIYWWLNLDLSFNKIKKIEGLDALTKLTDLSLSHNQIKTIENMDKLSELTALSIGHNQISDLSNVSLHFFKLYWAWTDDNSV
jgi:Leucine-rich repeat (LRR) protein